MIKRIFEVIIFIVALIYVLWMEVTTLIRKILTLVLWLIVNVIDVVLIIPLSFVWTLTKFINFTTQALLIVGMH